MVDNVFGWTPDKLIGLYRKLHECVYDEGMTDDDTFMFDGHEFVIGYAKYLVEYLSNKFSQQVDEGTER